MTLRRAQPAVMLAGLLIAAALTLLLPTSRAPLLAVLLLLAGASAYAATRIDPAWIASAALATSIFSSNSGRLGLPFPPDRALLALTLFGLAWRGIRGEAQTELRYRPVHYLMLALVAYILVSATWAGTLTQKTAVFHLIDRVGIVPFLLFYLAPRLYGTERQRNILLAFLVGTGAYIGLTAWFEAFHLRPLVFPKYILDQSIGINEGEGRARGPFLEAVANGLSIYGCACASIVAAVRWRGTWRWVALGIAGICLIGSIFSLTRAVWIGAAVGTLVALVVTRETRRYALAAAAAGAIAVVGIFAVAPQLASNAKARNENHYPLWARLNSNAAALRMVDAKPLFGFGWLRFETDNLDYFRQAPDYPLTGLGIEVHNIYLGYAVEIGILGLLLYLITFFFGTIGAARRPVRSDQRVWVAASTAFTVALVVVANFGPLAYSFPNQLVWLFAGIIYALPRPVAA